MPGLPCSRSAVRTRTDQVGATAGGAGSRRRGSNRSSRPPRQPLVVAGAPVRRPRRSPPSSPGAGRRLATARRRRWRGGRRAPSEVTRAGRRADGGDQRLQREGDRPRQAPRTPAQRPHGQARHGGRPRVRMKGEPMAYADSTQTRPWAGSGRRRACSPGATAWAIARGAKRLSDFDSRCISCGLEAGGHGRLRPGQHVVGDEERMIGGEAGGQRVVAEGLRNDAPGEGQQGLDRRGRPGRGRPRRGRDAGVPAGGAHRGVVDGDARRR